MFRLILFEPEIPPNTGNIIRLCANTGVSLHLVEPLGFELDEPRLKRAGLDYREFADVKTHMRHSMTRWTHWTGRACSRSVRATRRATTSLGMRQAMHSCSGRRPAGCRRACSTSLPQKQRLRLPMRAGNRSLNLSNAAAIVVYEAWRQLGFTDGR